MLFFTGQMKNILQTNLDKPAWLMKKLQYLHQISAEVCKKSIPYVKDSNPGYYNQLNPFIEEQVVKDKPYRRISLQVKWPKERLKFSGKVKKNVIVVIKDRIKWFICCTRH